MSFMMEDSVESDWVAVRPNVFDEKERHKFIFIVAWNEIEGKFAITCHNRTVQKRTAFRDSLLETVECDLVSPVTVKLAPEADKHKTPLKSPTKRKDDISTLVKVRSNVSPKEEKTTKSPIRERTAAVGASSRPAESVIKTLGSWDIVSCKVTDIEVLEPADVPSLPRSPDEGDGEESDSSREGYSWAGLFSFQDVRAAHVQLCAVNSDLEPCLPPFPEEPVGMWTVLFGAPEVSQRETDALCYQLQVYLGHALDTCGWKILAQVLFTESDDSEEYYESLSELRQKGYEDALQRAKKRLQELLERHRAMESMVELLQVYPEEDEAYGELLEATTQLYHYLLQPFRDMRELAMLRRQQIKISLETERLGPRRVEGLRRENEEWMRKAHAAVLSIQDLTVKFFETTARAQKAVYERMRVDQRKFGKSTWAAAVDRMERLQYAVSKETLQLMRAKEICLEQRKHSLKEEMQSLQEGENAMQRLDQMEALYYELQLQLYDIQAEVLRCEELLLNAQLTSLRRQITERQDEVVYYDAYESPDAMRRVEDPSASLPPLRDKLSQLQQKTRQLEARRGRITAKKAYLKTKKEICIINHNQKIQQRQGSKDDQTHQALQQRGEEQEEEEEEEKSNARMSMDRSRTLDRLRSFKQRFPGQVTLKSSRLRMSHGHSRRKTSSPLSPAGRPETLAASVQTDTVDLPELSAPPSDACGHQSVSLTPLGGATEPLSAPSLPPLSAIPSSAPPPPPPVPSLDDLSSEGVEWSHPTSPVRQSKAGSDSEPLPLAPFSPRFFDSSQLQTARKKLKKTAMLDSSQWRRASSPMDEVLNSLKRGSFHLRKAELRVLAPDPDDDESNNILAQIRQGVRLKKVRTQPEQQRHTKGLFPHSADALTRSIHEALRRIKEASPESESEDEGLPCTDWEN
ncbi:junction-mediating and -regulatory protein-like isoform X1 [Salvelinus alpinus]|uniref:junction-mediating and -regulatory protein-like isoform X1 n=1 Tax=Salvelinus alpinus TaxID=8036 RepID=UPI0039FC9C0D